MRQAKTTHILDGNCRISPQQVLVGVGTHAGPRGHFIELVHGLVIGIIAEEIDEDPPRRENLVPVAAECTPAAVANWDGTTGVVCPDARITFEHTGDCP